MDYLKSLLGVKNSQDSPLTFGESKQPPSDKPKTESSTTKTEIKDNDANRNNSSSRLEPSSSSERLEQLGNDIREVVKKVVPLEDDDCLSCKLIGTSVLWGTSVFVILSGRKYRKTVIGYKKVTATIGYGMSAFSLFLLGTARLFDMSIFQKDCKKSVYELAKDDVKMFKDFFQQNDGKEK